MLVYKHLWDFCSLSTSARVTIGVRYCVVDFTGNYGPLKVCARSCEKKCSSYQEKGKPGRPKKYKEVCIIYKFNCFGSEYSV